MSRLSLIVGIASIIDGLGWATVAVVGWWFSTHPNCAGPGACPLPEVNFPWLLVGFLVFLPIIFGLLLVADYVVDRREKAN